MTWALTALVLGVLIIAAAVWFAAAWLTIQHARVSSRRARPVRRQSAWSTERRREERSR